MKRARKSSGTNSHLCTYTHSREKQAQPSRMKKIENALSFSLITCPNFVLYIRILYCLNWVFFASLSVPSVPSLALLPLGYTCTVYTIYRTCYVLGRVNAMGCIAWKYRICAKNSFRRRVTCRPISHSLCHSLDPRYILAFRLPRHFFLQPYGQ